MLVAVAGALLVAALPMSASGGSAKPLLPDLGVAPIKHILITTGLSGKRNLRFTTSIADVGKGPMGIAASRPKLGTDWKVSQRITRSDGSTYLVPTPAVQMVFVGSESHGHWHARAVARYELRRLGDLETVRMRVKRGFCFFDSGPYRRSLPGAPQKDVYPRVACGKKWALKIDAGISVGWKDDYFWDIPGQAMDITTLPNGKYRLFVRVDPKNWFLETNERNNVTWVDIAIGKQTVEILRRSPKV